jgi:hypothetical protein
MSDVLQPIRDVREADERSAPRKVGGRRAGCLLLAAVTVLALFNVFGQRAHDSTASSPAAVLTLRAPSHVRAGLMFQAKFTIVALQPIKAATLVLGRGWLDGLTQNTNEPSATTETSAPNGGLSLSLGTLKPGQTFVQYLELQINPTTSGSKPEPVFLDSGSTRLLSLDHTMTVFP